jgi:hypothetical protein
MAESVTKSTMIMKLRQDIHIDLKVPRDKKDFEGIVQEKEFVQKRVE